MAISDVLAKASKDLAVYLTPECLGWYTEAQRNRIRALVAEMNAILALPGFDAPPSQATHVFAGDAASVASMFKTPEKPVEASKEATAFADSIAKQR